MTTLELLPLAMFIFVVAPLGLILPIAFGYVFIMKIIRHL